MPGFKGFDVDKFDIQTGWKTILEYLLRPVTCGFDNVFRERLLALREWQSCHSLTLFAGVVVSCYFTPNNSIM